MTDIASRNGKRMLTDVAKQDVKKKPKLITDFFSKRSESTLKKDAQDKIDVETTVNTITKDTKISISSKQSSLPAPITSKNVGAGRIDDAEFCRRHGFDMQKWVDSLTEEQRDLLDLEIRHLNVTWLVFLHKTITKPYFLQLKRFLREQRGKTVFPPAENIYSWSHLTPVHSVRCLILGQDPYHNFNQAHGLAFSVLEPTRPPPSLVNIYKALAIDYPEFVVPDYYKLAREGRPGGGNLTKWARRGVLMLNAVLTVEAHKANSHAQKGWETFTEEVIRTAINYCNNERSSGFVIMAWGSPAQKRILPFRNILGSKFLVLKTVHPSPLSANRGFFDLHVFKKCNEWLAKTGQDKIDWGIVEGNVVK